MNHETSVTLTDRERELVANALADHVHRLRNLPSKPEPKPDDPVLALLREIEALLDRIYPNFEAERIPIMRAFSDQTSGSRLRRHRALNAR